MFTMWSLLVVLLHASGSVSETNTQPQRTITLLSATPTSQRIFTRNFYCEKSRPCEWLIQPEVHTAYGGLRIVVTSGRSFEDLKTCGGLRTVRLYQGMVESGTDLHGVCQNGQLEYTVFVKDVVIVVWSKEKRTSYYPVINYFTLPKDRPSARRARRSVNDTGQAIAFKRFLAKKIPQRIDSRIECPKQTHAKCDLAFFAPDERMNVELAISLVDLAAERNGFCPDKEVIYIDENKKQPFQEVTAYCGNESVEARSTSHWLSLTYVTDQGSGAAKGFSLFYQIARKLEQDEAWQPVSEVASSKARPKRPISTLEITLIVINVNLFLILGYLVMNWTRNYGRENPFPNGRRLTLRRSILRNPGGGRMGSLIPRRISWM